MIKSSTLLISALFFVITAQTSPTSIDDCSPLNTPFIEEVFQLTSSIAEQKNTGLAITSQQTTLFGNDLITALQFDVGRINKKRKIKSAFIQINGKAANASGMLRIVGIDENNLNNLKLNSHRPVSSQPITNSLVKWQITAQDKRQDWHCSPDISEILNEILSNGHITGFLSFQINGSPNFLIENKADVNIRLVINYEDNIAENNHAKDLNYTRLSIVSINSDLKNIHINSEKDIHTLPPGFYILNYFINDNLVTRKKLFINNKDITILNISN